MATKRNRGRDPEQHEILAAGAEANNYVGLLGQITVTRAPEIGVTGISVHNGVTPGGARVSLAAPGVAQGFPGAVVVPALEVAVAGVATVTHNLGYWPIVQVVLVSSRAVVAATVVHAADFNSFTIDTPTDAPHIVLMR
jgi:hypothetical protein